MTTKTKILIGILVLAVIICIGYILYSRATCIDSNEQCEGKPDGTGCTSGIWCDQFGRICGGQSCVGLGLGMCINNKCELKEISLTPDKQVVIPSDKKVVIATDKTEYALGEKAKIIVRNNLEEPIWYVDYVCPPWWNLEVYETGGWKLIEDFSPAYTYRFCQEEEKFCYKGLKEIYYYCPLSKPVQDFVEKLEPNSEITKIWTLKNRKYYDGIRLNDINPGNYKLLFTYGFSQNTYNTNSISSNDFKVKKGLWREIADVCKEDKEFIEGIRSDPECLKGEGFRCIDGWGGTTYYDKRQVSASTIESATNWPVDAMPSFMPKDALEELEKATIARYGQSACYCEKPISYEILVGDKFEEVSCEKFYQFLQNYEPSCGDCILMWSYGCC